MAGDASEQTLQELLAEAKAMSASLQKIASILGKAPSSTKSGGDSAKGKTDEVASGLMNQASKFLPLLGPAGVALKVLSVALDLVTKAFNILGDIIGDLVGRFSNAIGAVGKFAEKALAGTATLTDMVDMFGDIAKQLPIVGGALGMLAGAVSFVTKRLEESYKSYKDLANAGMTFGGNLIEMRQSIQQSGLTIDEFTSIATKNSELFATMGGSVEKGGKLFLKSQEAISSGLGKEFAGLGLNAKDASEYLISYMKSQGSINKQGLQDSKANAQAALELAQQTQFLSDVTGKRKQQIQDEIDAKLKEQNVEAYLASLSAEEAAAAREKYNYALQKAGKDTADMVMTGLMTGVVQPATAAQAQQAAITGNATTEFAETLVKAKGAPAEMQKTLAKANADLVTATDESYKNFGNVNALRMAQGKGDLYGAGQLAERTRNLENGQLMSKDKMVAKELEQRKKVTDLSGSQAAALGDAQNNLKQFGLKLNGAIDSVLGVFAGPLTGMLDSASKFLLDHAKDLQAVAQKFAEWLKPWVDGVITFFSKWFNRFMEPDADIPTLLKKMFKEAMDNIKPLLEPVFKWLGEVLKDSIKSLFLVVLDAILSLIPGYETLKNALNRAGEQDITGAAGGASEGEAIMNASENAEPAPSQDNGKKARDWAWSVMSGQAKESQIPASIKDQVTGIMDSDSSLKQQAEKYKADMAKKREEEQRQREKEAANSKKSSDQENQPDAAKPTAAAPVAAQESKADPITLLNSNIERLIRSSQEVADHTKSTANILASNGNLFRRG